MAYQQNRNPFKKIQETPIYRKNLEDGVEGKANLDGSIHIDNSVTPNSPLEKKIIRHEKQHLKDMDSGKLSYTDNHVIWDGKKYRRKDGMIKYKGKWCPEGSNKLPWEKEAKSKEN
jgi:hypothetical protein